VVAGVLLDSVLELRRDSTLQELAIQVEMPNLGSTQRIKMKYPARKVTIQNHSGMRLIPFAFTPETSPVSMIT
jgi:hypothetical protein